MGMVATDDTIIFIMCFSPEIEGLGVTLIIISFHAIM